MLCRSFCRKKIFLMKKVAHRTNIFHRFSFFKMFLNVICFVCCGIFSPVNDYRNNEEPQNFLSEDKLREHCIGYHNVGRNSYLPKNSFDSKREAKQRNIPSCRSRNVIFYHDKCKGFCSFVNLYLKGRKKLYKE